MASEIYFQWQNEFLRRTIYPLREMKLRDFLVYFAEIELWARFKDKKIEDLQAEVDAYHQAIIRQQKQAYENFVSLREYFLNPDVTERYRQKFSPEAGAEQELDPKQLAEINEKHRLFQRYFLTYNNPVKERYFIGARISELEGRTKQYLREIADNERKIRNMGPTWAKTPFYQARNKLLQEITLPMLDEEISRLRAFLAACGQLETRRSELAKWKTAKNKELVDLETRWMLKNHELAKAEKANQDLQDQLNRLKSPPDYETLKSYFLTQDVADLYFSKFAEPDPYFMGIINQTHREFLRFPAELMHQRYFVEFLITTYSKYWPFQRGVALLMSTLEMSLLKDLALAIDIQINGPTLIAHQIAQVEKNVQQAQAVRDQKQSEAQALEAALELVQQALSVSEEEQLVNPTRLPNVTVRDIVRGKAEEYRRSLEEKSPAELLEMVAMEFVNKPEKYPLWLQYMVIHFSGMRYQSAHGSWANPREILLALVERSVERQVGALDDWAVEALCQDRLQLYEAAFAGQQQLSDEQGVPAALPPGLALAQDLKWKAKAHSHIERLKALKRWVRVIPAGDELAAVVYKLTPTGMQPTTNILYKSAELIVDPIPLVRGGEFFGIDTYYRNPAYKGLYLSGEDLIPTPDSRKRKTLLDLHIDEKAYEIEVESDDQQVLDELRALKSQDEKDGQGNQTPAGTPARPPALPGWMWNEIVRLTDLRLKEVQSEKWEELTPQETEERNAYRMWEYRQLMNKWQQANLTGWREEHDRTNRLIVTRAVCNEVAEHIQHLRGHSPPGGLTAKPQWYLRNEKAAAAAGGDQPFLVKAKSAADFVVGASILWLRFVNEEPNAWRIAHPITLKNGEGLLSPAVNVSHGTPSGRQQFSLPPGRTIKSAGEFRYYQDPEGRYKRRRIIVDSEDDEYEEDLYLRWMHEATVAMVAETADGPTVLTFETALPYEDRLRSTIGVFKHPLDWLKYNVSGSIFNGTFIGYLPQSALPLADLKEMLDWNRILQRSDMPTPAQVRDYWQKVEQLAGGVQPGSQKETWVEVQPQLQSALPAGSRETVPIFEYDPLTRSLQVYQPAESSMLIALRRGTRLWVSMNDEVGSGAERYYRIIRCEAEPRAQDFYIRAGEVIELPEDGSSKPVSTPTTLRLWTIASVNGQGKPVMADVKVQGKPVQIMAGARFQVSTVQKFSPAALPAALPGDVGGLLKDAQGKSYALVLECPSRSSAAGFFVPAGQLREITMEEYRRSAAEIGEVDEQIKVKVEPAALPAALPRGKQPNALLYQQIGGLPGGKPDRQFVLSKTGENLPRGTELVIRRDPEFAKQQAYYRILECPARAEFVGLYLDAEDVSL
jgi:hypothetical protein